MVEIIKYGSKRFLSEEDVYSTGSICTYSIVEEGSWHSAGIILKDCNKTITLEMGYEDEASLLERVNKIDILIEELSKYKEVLKEHFPIQQEQMKKCKKREGEGDEC